MGVMVVGYLVGVSVGNSLGFCVGDFLFVLFIYNTLSFKKLIKIYM